MKSKEFNKINIDDLIYVGCIKLSKTYDYQHGLINIKGDTVFLLNYYLENNRLCNLCIYDVSGDTVIPLKRYTVFRPTKMGRYELEEVANKIAEIEILVETKKIEDTYITYNDFQNTINKSKNKIKRLKKIKKLLNKEENIIQKIFNLFFK